MNVIKNEKNRIDGGGNPKQSHFLGAVKEQTIKHNNKLANLPTYMQGGDFSTNNEVLFLANSKVLTNTDQRAIWVLEPGKTANSWNIVQRSHSKKKGGFRFEHRPKIGQEIEGLDFTTKDNQAHYGGKHSPLKVLLTVHLPQEKLENQHAIHKHVYNTKRWEDKIDPTWSKGHQAMIKHYSFK